MLYISRATRTLYDLICSLNIGEGGIALAEAVHGSAPDIAGKVRPQSGFMIFNIVASLDPWNIIMLYAFICLLVFAILARSSAFSYPC